MNASGISVFMFSDDLGYKERSEQSKNYSVQQHIIDSKAARYKDPSYWRNRIIGNYIGRFYLEFMEYYWKKGLQCSIVDVGAQYFFIGLMLAKYIKTSGHFANIYAFDCGVTAKLTQYNIKLNQVEDIVKFEYNAVSNSSMPHLVYYDSEHSEDNHIVKRHFDNLPSYVVDGITLDDYFLTNKDIDNMENLIIKIDAQGVEPLIFEGMQKILHTENSPAIIFEFVPWVCKSIMDPVEFLSSLPEEYTMYNLDDTSKDDLQRIERCDFPNFVRKVSAKQPPYTDLLILNDKGVVDADVVRRAFKNPSD